MKARPGWRLLAAIVVFILPMVACAISPSDAQMMDTFHLNRAEFQCLAVSHRSSDPCGCILALTSPQLRQLQPDSSLPVPTLEIPDTHYLRATPVISAGRTTDCTAQRTAMKKRLRIGAISAQGSTVTLAIDQGKDVKSSLAYIYAPDGPDANWRITDDTRGDGVERYQQAAHWIADDWYIWFDYDF